MSTSVSWENINSCIRVLDPTASYMHENKDMLCFSTAASIQIDSSMEYHWNRLHTHLQLGTQWSLMWASVQQTMRWRDETSSRGRSADALAEDTQLNVSRLWSGCSQICLLINYWICSILEIHPTGYITYLNMHPFALLHVGWFLWGLPISFYHTQLMAPRKQ